MTSESKKLWLEYQNMNWFSVWQDEYRAIAAMNGQFCAIFIFSHTVHLDIVKVFYSPTDAQVNCLLSNSATYTHQVPTNICSHITTHQCILIGYFKNCNFSKHE
jgi:hypothetical protein